MPLIVLHKILIASAAALGVFLAIWGFHEYTKLGKGSSLAVGIGGLVIAAVLFGYFRTIDRRYANVKKSGQRPGANGGGSS